VKINHYQTVAIDILQEIENYVEIRRNDTESIAKHIPASISNDLFTYVRGQQAAFDEVLTVLHNFYTPEVPSVTNTDQA
jgi:hypothetical protein